MHGDYKCEICDESFGQKPHLNRHIETEHNYKCEICGKSFGQKSVLNSHIKAAHEKQRGNKCGICGNDFGKVHKERHERKVHNIK